MRPPKHLRKGMIVYVDGDPEPWVFRSRVHPEYYGTVTFLANGGVKKIRGKVPHWDLRWANLRRERNGDFQFATVLYPRLKINAR